MKRFTTTALATLFAAPFLIATPVLAESHVTANDGSGEMTQDQSGAMATETDAANDPQAEAIVVTVGDAEITAGDVAIAVSALPPQIRQRPAEQVIPFTVEQLILRELILQDAEAKGITGDMSDDGMESDSASATDEMSEDGDTDTASNAQDDAMQSQQDAETIQAYMDQELGDVVTDETVQAAYDEIADNATTEVPPLEAVRPQIEQQLRQQAMRDLRNTLGDSVEIVYYGPDGQPREVSTTDNG
ncbi:hypothetical protein ILP92_00865 [Maribius pontilimi]|uniref:SurA N-terminal domain-containing protein n=1 Tax=Palleronia pontilimi TaxID=1964209 RepID=A0A934IB98_9RHOB|nr:hypothetical protein [Palleronia pontilimi]MBJ3761302.1 hypothetical protein [Palleronia pontilimi]